MIQFDLIRKSPMRILDRALCGGLKKGQLGLISSQAGGGKTALLIQIAIDRMLQGLGVVHVSFKTSSIKINQWYETTLNELARAWGIDHSYFNKTMERCYIWGVRETEKPRDEMLKTLVRNLNYEKILPSLIVCDDFDLNKDELFEKIRGIAADLSCELWFTNTDPSDKAPISYNISIVGSSLLLKKNAEAEFAPIKHINLDTNNFLAKMD